MMSRGQCQGTRGHIDAKVTNSQLNVSEFYHNLKIRWVATPGPTPQEIAREEQEQQMELKVSFCISLLYLMILSFYTVVVLQSLENSPSSFDL